MSNQPSYRFDGFLLDVSDRQLWRGDVRADLNARYFNALVLLVRKQGQLVDKDQFFTEVWDDVVVSDEALTQCIRTIRKQLGDDATDPRFIRTVPGHGYRFIADVEVVGPDEPAESARGDELAAALRAAGVQGVAGTLGGGVAGLIGGLLYGFGLAHGPGAAELGTTSILVSMLGVNSVVGVVGGLGVSFGMVATDLVTARPGWRVAGAAVGGMIVGGLVKLLGVDAFNLLFGHAPADITGGLEGAALGAGLALGAHFGGGLDAPSRWRPVVGGGLGGAAAGVAIPLLGGRLMGGSLALLARSFADSRLRLDSLGRFFGELHFGYTTQVALGAVEGLVFGACVLGAIVLARAAQNDGAAASAAKTTPDGTSGPRLA